MAQTTKYLHIVDGNGDHYAISLWDAYEDALTFDDYIKINGYYAALETEAILVSVGDPTEVPYLRMLTGDLTPKLLDDAPNVVITPFEDEFDGGGGQYAGAGIDDRWWYEWDELANYAETGGFLKITADTDYPCLWQTIKEETIAFDVRIKIKISDLPATFAAGESLEAGFDLYPGSQANNAFIIFSIYQDGCYIESNVNNSDYQWVGTLGDTSTDIHLRIKWELVSGTTWQCTTYYDQDNGDSPSWTQLSQANFTNITGDINELCLYAGRTGGTEYDVSFYYMRNV